MLSTETFLALYYLGFGFMIFLSYLAVADRVDPGFAAPRRKRLHRLAVGIAMAGLLHPGFALAGRDLAAQLGRPDGLLDPGALRTIRLTSWELVGALAPLVLVFASVLGPLEDAPVLRQIREGLPFA